MATGSVPNIFECAVCLNPMLDRTPRGLICFHTFCEECLVPLVKDKQILCPSCRKATALKENDVKLLPVNFFLSQMKDFVSLKDNKTECERTEDIEQACQICQNKPATYKCVECTRKMCALCKQRHSNIKIYENHNILELCLNHNDVVENICKTCHTPLCKICVSEHEDHQNHFLDYTTAVKELKTEAQAVEQEILIAEKEYDGNFYEMVKTNEGNKIVLQELQDRRRYHAERVKEADKLIKITEDHLAHFKEFQIQYDQTRFGCEELKCSIKNLDEDRSKFAKFPKFKMEAIEMVRNLNRNFNDEYDMTPFVIGQHAPTNLVIQHLEYGESLGTFSTNGNDGYLKQLGSTGSEVLAITMENSCHVIKMSQGGEVLAHYYPQKTGDISSISSYDDDIYIAQENVINVVSTEQQRTSRIFRFRIDNIEKMLVVDSRNILLSSRETGKIYCYNTEENKTNTVVQGLKGPTYINIMFTDKGTRYIITETDAHCVKIYTENWTLLHTIGTCGTSGSSDGMLNTPRATAVTEQNTILIADQNNHRISHFTMEGKFLSIVLTKKHGINYPIGLLYRNNRLWVSDYYSGQIKVFRLMYKED